MDMKAKSSLIRRLRAERLWSQEHLAQVSGLGLRTIQRIETRGSVSQESIKALASVFEVTPEELVWRDGSYQTYKHRQWGIVTLAIIPLFVFTILMIENISQSMPPTLLGLLFGILTITGIVFSSMTIEVNESELSWFFGPGFFKKQLQLEEIGDCKKVKNPLWMGFGIHAFGTGWIYNVSGLLGVEIELKSGAYIRLGTNEPNYLVNAIEDAKDNSA